MITIIEWKNPIQKIFFNIYEKKGNRDKESEDLKLFYDCKLSAFVVYKKNEKGMLLFNALTLELIYLNMRESKALQNYVVTRNISSFRDDIPLLFFLYEHLFLIKKEQNICQLANETRDLIYLLEGNNKTIKSQHSFLILPTTDCNARCYYCFEHGAKKINMNSETAEAVGPYILSKLKDLDEKISVCWFGGEPLMQIPIIDQICACLNQHKKAFHSSIVTNGYLFNKEVIQKAKEVWHLKKVQITLDGPEDVYNRTKAYINPTENPYFRVLDNIQLLSENEIHVNIRINYAFGQYEETIQLFDELEKRFSGHQMISVDIHGIFQEISADVSDQQRKKIFDDILSLKKELIGRKLSRGEKLPKHFVTNCCMADSGTSAVILPDGRLTSCEHYNNEIKCWGSVFSEDIDESAKAYWSKRWELQEECETCFYYPLCIRLKHCPNENGKCLPEDRDMYRYKLEQGMLNAWEDYKKEHDLQKI